MKQNTYGQFPRRFTTAAVLFFLVQSAQAAITFRGCFVSGPDLMGMADPLWDADVDTITGALVGTGSWKAGNATKLKNGTLAAITDCVAAAKAASMPGDEFVFFFSGHGGDGLFPDAAEAGEGGGSDNHIRVGDAGGMASRITDDALTLLLSGFRFSVTLNVILDSCYSHTFYDGANDLSNVTEVMNGNPVNASDHLALLAASSPAMPTCGSGFTSKLAEGLTYVNGKLRADTNMDGTVTTEEAGRYAGAYMPGAKAKCDDGTCDIPTDAESTHRGPVGCGALDPVCPTTAQAVPEAGPLWLTGAGLMLIGIRRRRKRT